MTAPTMYLCQLLATSANCLQLETSALYSINENLSRHLMYHKLALMSKFLSRSSKRLWGCQHAPTEAGKHQLYSKDEY